VTVDETYVDRLTALGRGAGLDAIGLTDASVLDRARGELRRRLDLGLHDGMAFTYRNPERSTDPAAAVKGARAVVVGARSYWMDGPPRPPGVVGSVARYAWVDHYAPLREALWVVARRLREDGYAAVVFADDNSLVDREVAWRAGIGWFGKNANLLLPGAGSWFVLGAVVTDAPLPAVHTPVEDGCGRCRQCVPACPTGAIVADGVIDAGRCLAWVLQKPGVIPLDLRAAVGDRMYGCDDCQTSCPPTVRFGSRHVAVVPEPARPWVDVVALLAADDEGVLATWGRWYLADRDPTWARRNALVVLGNVGAGDDPTVVAVLTRYLHHPNVVLRCHATWAARRLGRPDLLPVDDDPDVRHEQRAELRNREAPPRHQ
jgi:epoxyqueuosine reductase